MIVRIDDPADGRVQDYFSLTDVGLRRTLEPASGLFIAESEKVIRRALAAGYRPRSYLMAERWLDDLSDIVGSSPVPVYVASAEVIRQMTGFHLHRGALASMHRVTLPTPEQVLSDARRVLICEDIVDHTNLGAIFRSAAALGMDGVLVTPRCADPLYRRSIRVSMGTVFQVPWTRIEPWPTAAGRLQAQGWTVASFALADEAVSLDSLAADPPARLALVVGTEGDGLSPATLEASDLVVTIPMAGAVDSLNVAAATAVAAWALRLRDE